jgi:hypothetical protein
MVMTISIFQRADQAEASADLAAEWVAEALADFNITRVGVIDGVVKVSRAHAEMLEPAHS